MDDLEFSDRVALLTRCPELSDGAKVTMLEILMHYGIRKLPSLNQMKRLRDTAKSTIQNHFNELVDAGLLKKEGGDDNSKYRICDKKLLRLNGLTDTKQIRKWIKTFDAAETSDVKVVKTVTTDSSRWFAEDAARYFLLLHERKGLKTDSEFKKHCFAIMRRMFREHGANNLRKMIDYFADNHRRMNLEFTAPELLDASNKVLCGVYKHRRVRQ